MRDFFRNPIVIILIILMVINTVLGGTFSSIGAIRSWLWNILLSIPGIVIGLSFHEYAHAKVAYMLGDNTPKHQGRVTLNPLAHIDPIGLIAILFIGFGWGKAVEINPYNFKNRRRDSFFVSIAGVTMNFILAFLFTAVIWAIPELRMEALTRSIGNYSIPMLILLNVVIINLVLMIFNLLPVPPLDGFNVITEIFNLSSKPIWYQIYNMGFPILMLLILLQVPGKILQPALNAVFGFIWGIFF